MFCPSEHPASSHVVVSGLQSVSTVLPYRPVRPPLGLMSVQWIRSTGVSYRCSMTKYRFPLLLECVVWSKITAEAELSSAAASDRCSRNSQLGSQSVYLLVTESQSMELTSAGWLTLSAQSNVSFPSM